MTASFPSLRLPRLRQVAIFTPILIVVALIWHYHEVIRLAITLVSLPLAWYRDSPTWIISKEHDNFDVTFADYAVNQTSAGEGYEDRVPAIIHHIMMGTGKPKDGWNDAMQSCIDVHPGWESMHWTDETATKLVAEKFPAFKPTWDGYKLPIQRIDSLRYMILYEYGGAILDMDIQCKRALGPLRRFDFIAPAAHPTGFSVSFIMSSRHNEFVGSLIDKWLKVYDRQWFNLPYATVMWSTGGHFASVIHAMVPDRSQLKVLAGPPDNFKLHTINGPVSTPLFNHLGSSSWHSYDGLFIMSMGKYLKYVKWVIIVAVVAAVAAFVYRRMAAKKSDTAMTPAPFADLDGPAWYASDGRMATSVGRYARWASVGTYNTVVDTLAYLKVTAKRRGRSLSLAAREQLEKRVA